MQMSEITKEVFEAYVPAAQMPQRSTSVYDRLQKAFERAYGVISREIIGLSFVDTVEQDNIAKANIQALVCIMAFVNTARSLDLVLTATGFGIVSTDSTAPASKVRVDSLIEQMRLEMYERKCELLEQLTHIEGWGTSPVAASNVNTLFWRFRDMDRTTLERTADSWLWALGQAVDADRLLRKSMGDEMMQRLLVHERTAGSDEMLTRLTAECLRVMATLISWAKTNTPPQQYIFDDIVRMLEEHADDLPEYKNSKIYQARHHEGYQNKAEDPTFFFM